MFLYLRAFGKLESMTTGKQLIPVFPNIPETPINGFGGYVEPIALETHNTYGEYSILRSTGRGHPHRPLGSTSWRLPIKIVYV